jgi:phospholipid/cholesterol/gamma-HCH transport system ATP-binding protein
VPEPSQPVFHLEKVTKSFNGLVVLKDLDLDIRRGQTTVVIGPSGCGKSVLLKHLVRLLRPDSGRVFFDGLDITGLSERRLAPIRRRMGFVFQGSALFDSMSVRENVYFPMIEHGIRSEGQQAERCARALRLVGMDGTQEKMPEELSGGQKKRLALARAIVLDPEVILYDEPTTGLDPIRADLINELILRLQRELKTTSLVVTHDMSSARKVADRILMLHDGRILIDTTPAGLDQVDNDIVARFVQGRATAEEMAELSTGYIVQGSQPA